MGGGKLLSSKISFSRILLLFVCCIFCNNVFAQSDDWRTIQDFESSPAVTDCYSKDIYSSYDKANDVAVYSLSSHPSNEQVTAEITNNVGNNSSNVSNVGRLYKNFNDNYTSYGIVFRVSLGSNTLSDYSKIKLDTYTTSSDKELSVYVRQSGTDNSFKKLFVLHNGFGPANTWATMGWPKSQSYLEEVGSIDGSMPITTTGMDYSDVEFYIGYREAYGEINVYIDNIQLFGPAIGTVKIKEGESNTITAKEKATVKLYRSLTAYTWNTICLPFVPSPDQVKEIFGEGAKFAQFSSVSNGVMQFTSVAGSLVAGRPYLVLPTKSQTALSPIELTDVNIEATGPETVIKNGYQFKGIYSPTPFAKKDWNKIRFVADGNKLKFPNTANPNNSDESTPLKALRAYFILPDDALHAKDYFYDVDSFVPTSIANIQIEGDGDGAIYNIGGQRVEGKSLPKGIYIRDGKKFVVK